ncbi:MAG: tetratricopeptide repeat protein [Flavobacteriales bacterium]
MRRKFGISFEFILVFVGISCFAINSSRAQPGGGGGIVIRNVYDGNGNTIFQSDSTWEIASYEMNGVGLNAVISKSYENTYFPGWYGESEDPVPIHFSINHDPSRIWIMNYSDTMLLDITGIPGENPMGYISYIDSLVFIPGAYILEFSTEGRHETMSISPQSLPALLLSGKMKKMNRVPTEFLDPKNFTNAFLLNQIHFDFFNTENYDAAYEKVQRVLSNKPDKDEYFKAKQMEARILQARGKYREALEIVESIYCIERFDETRGALVQLYTRVGEYNKAMEVLDLNALRRGDYGVAERARYCMQYLQDSAGAVEDYLSIIDKIPSDYMHDRLIGSSEYGYAFKELGDVYLALENWDLAVRYYYKSVAFYSNAQYISDILTKLELLRTEKPGLPLAELTIAVCNVRLTVYSNGSDPDHYEFPRRAASAFDACTDEEKSMAMYHYHRGELHSLQQEYDLAYTSLSKAISLDPRNARYYLLRFTVRNRMTGPEHKNAIDDQKRALELSKEWVFPK